MLPNMMSIFFILVAGFRSISCLEEPFIYYNYTQFLTINEGDTIKLECYPDESYTSIKWYRKSLNDAVNQDLSFQNGEEFLYGNELIISYATKFNGGRYICSVNHENRMYFGVIEVKLNYLPDVFSMFKSNHPAFGDTTLECFAKSNPPPKRVLWTKNGKSLQLLEDTKIYKLHELDDGFISNITIPDYNCNKHDIFKCTFENALGYGSDTFRSMCSDYSP